MNSGSPRTDTKNATKFASIFHPNRARRTFSNPSKFPSPCRKQMGEGLPGDVTTTYSFWLHWGVWNLHAPRTRHARATHAPRPYGHSSQGMIICMEVHGYAWICMGMLGCAWVCMDMHGCAWICKHMHGYVWICMDMYRNAWVCMGRHGYAWQCMDVNGCAW